jgi:flagellar assembly protein FliH
MPLIRNKNAAHFTHQAVALELENVRSEAEALLAAARAQADSILASARAEATAEQAAIRERARSEAFEQGLEEGRAQGQEEGHAQAFGESIEPYRELLEKLAPAWLEQFEQFGQERERLFEQARRDLVGFAVELAGRIVHRTIEHDPSVCQDQVAQTLTLLGHPTQMQLSINPADRELIDQALPGLLAAAGGTPDLSVIEEPSIGRGGCVLSTPQGTIDSSIEVQLDRIMESLLPGGDA